MSNRTHSPGFWYNQYLQGCFTLLDYALYFCAILVIVTGGTPSHEKPLRWKASGDWLGTTDLKHYYNEKLEKYLALAAEIKEMWQQDVVQLVLIINSMTGACNQMV